MKISDLLSTNPILDPSPRAQRQDPPAVEISSCWPIQNHPNKIRFSEFLRRLDRSSGSETSDQPLV